MNLRMMCFLLVTFILFGCREDIQYGADEIVVEGWIESGAGPVVILSRTLTVTTQEEVNEDDSFVLPWGKVTVSDGVESVILTGDYDERYFPPYIYSTSRIKGIPGRTYYLTVEYADRVVTAQTTIPEVDSLEALTVTPCAEVDSMYQITAYYDDNPATKDYYMFLARVFNRETRYYPANLGLADDEKLTLHNQQVVQPGNHSLTNVGKKYRPFYHRNDSVQIKFARVDATTYAIHKAYSDMDILNTNALFTSDVSMPTNINGGLGFWCGYAVTKYNVTIGDSIR